MPHVGQVRRADDVVQEDDDVSPDERAVDGQGNRAEDAACGGLER